MSKIRTFLPLIALAIACSLTPQAEAAEAGANCDIDITKSVPADVDWRDVYMIRGEDGYVWQRALVSGPSANLQLEEGKPFNINGTADPNADTQIFLFSTDAKQTGAVRKPALSNCVSGGKANQDGYFAIPINSRVIWDLVGGDMMVDAFFRLDKLWEQQQGTTTNQNYLIGTHIPPAIVRVEAKQAIPAGCQTLCQGYQGSSGLQQVVILDPKKYPDVHNNNFTAVKDAPVALGKFGQTFYAGTLNQKTGEKHELSELTMKTLTMEVLKQFLLGQRGMDAANGMPAIDKESLEAAFAGTQYSPVIQKVVQAVQKTLTGAVGSPEREQGLQYLTTLLQNEIKCLPPKCMSPTRQTMFEIFPAGRPGTDWAYDFLDMLLLWTSKLDANKCILDENQMSSELQKNFYDQGWHHRLIVDCSWYMTYTHGYSSPAILIHGIKPATLTPRLKALRIMTVDRQFDTADSWQLKAGKKMPILYRYEALQPIAADYSGESCVAAADLSDYADYLGRQLGLRADEVSVLAKELQAEIAAEGFTRLRIADQRSVAARFGWNLDGKAADIYQLFFEAEAGACAKTAFAAPDLALTPVAEAGRQGFEAGLID